MKARNNKANFIIIIIVVLLLLLAIIMQILLNALTQDETQSNNIKVVTGNQDDSDENLTVKEIIENAGSTYISTAKGIFTTIYVNFKYDLYSDNGKSNETYFNNLIEQIEELEKDTFYLIDEEKNIEINVYYDNGTGKYTVRINELDNFYKETTGESYVDISKTQIVQQSGFAVTNELYSSLQLKAMKYANSIIVTSEREQLPNGYYTYPTEHIKAKLGGGKVLNLIFDKDYEGEIAKNVYVTTKLSDVETYYPIIGFGSRKEGFLGYRSSTSYVFLYEDEVSIYPYKYQENEYFDQYLSDYCATGNLDKLVSDFTTSWSSYFEFDYDAENQNLKLVFPTRGIAMNIKNNDSKGITIYNNYYLTDTVKELIKNNKISIEPDEDLILITEQNRRESMK
jgi:hypothetical protein